MLITRKKIHCFCIGRYEKQDSPSLSKNKQGRERKQGHFLKLNIILEFNAIFGISHILCEK